MSTTSDRVGVQAKEASDDLKEMGTTVKDVAQEKLTEVSHSIPKYHENGRDNVHGVLCNFEQYVRERPVRSVLTAAAIGLLFGRFWMRR